MVSGTYTMHGFSTARTFINKLDLYATVSLKALKKLNVRVYEKLKK